MNKPNKQKFYPDTYRSELSFRNRLGRGLWSIVYLIFFRPSPRLMFGWRRLLLKCFGADIDRKAVVYPSARIWAPWNLRMGRSSVLGDFVDCYSVDEITLEADVTVSQYAFICTASHDIDRPERTLLHRPILLKRGCWVFAGAFVGPGVTIHEGAVVAARSVVVKDVGRLEVVGGNPSRLIRHRKAKWLEED